MREASKPASEYLCAILPVAVHNSPKFGSIAERRRHGGRMGSTLDLTLGSYRDYVLCCLSRMVQVCTELNTNATSM